MIKIKVKRGSVPRSSIVVLVDKEDKTLILLRPGGAHWAPFKWGFPGGKIEDGESALEAALRETKEETQLDITNLKLLNLEVDKPLATYYTRDYTGTIQIDHEHEAWAWVSRDEIEKYDLAPEVLIMYDWVLENE